MAQPYDIEEEEGLDIEGLGPLGALFSSMNSTTTEAKQVARGILERNEQYESETPDEVEILGALQSNAEAARQALREARQRLIQQRINPAGAWLAASAALGAPTRTGGLSESFGRMSESLIPYVNAKEELERSKSTGLLDLDQAMTGVDSNLLNARLKLAQMQREARTGMSKEALKILGKNTTSTGRASIPERAVAAVDAAYAQEYIDFIQNGAPDAAKALSELRTARDTLRGGQDTLTGPIIGSVATTKLPVIGNIGKPIQDIAFPDSANVQEQVEATVQRSLRPILGAQFTQQEGERLISRVYNPRLEENVNADRLDRLIAQLERAYENKVEAARYFEKNHTLAGFQGRTQWTVDDFIRGVESGDAPRRGRRVIRLEDLRRGQSKPPTMQDEGFPADEPRTIEGPRPPGSMVRPIQRAEGGLAFREEDEPEPGRMLVEMPDGTILDVPEGTTAEEIEAAYTPPESPTTPENEDPGGVSDHSVADQMRSGLAYGAEGLLGTGLGALAGKYGVSTGDWLLDRVVPRRRETPAERRVLDLLTAERDTPGDLIRRTRALQRARVPAKVIDEAGPQLRRAGEIAMGRGAEEGPDLLEDLTTRQQDSRARVSDQLNQALKPDEYFAQMDKLKSNLYSQAKPLYETAYKNAPSVKAPSLFRIMDDKDGKAAVKLAIRYMKNDGIPIGKKDATGMVKNPSLQFLDYVKRGLDDVIRREEKDGATNLGRQLRTMRNNLRDELDAASPEYKQARAQYAGDLEVLDALRMGKEEFKTMSPQEVVRFMQGVPDASGNLVGGASFAEKDALRSGIFAWLEDRADTSSAEGYNAAQALIGSPKMRKKLQAVLDPKDFKLLEAGLAGETKLFDQSRGMIRRGESIRMSHALDARDTLHKAAKAAPSLGFASPFRWVLRALSRKPDMSEEEADEVAKLLRAGSTRELAALEKNLSAKAARRVGRTGRKRAAMALGAILGGGAVTSGSGDEEQDNAER